jgi:hypothetical protein
MRTCLQIVIESTLAPLYKTNLRGGSINSVSTVTNKRRSLHETRFTAGKEQDAISHLLRSSHATHGRNTYSRTQHFGVGLGHRRVYYTGADGIDSNEIFRVLDHRLLVWFIGNDQT